MKYLIITYLFFGSYLASSQDYLNDTMSVSPTGTYLHSLYEVDSGYYWVGMVPHPSEPGNPVQFAFGFTNYNGNWETRLLDYDTLQNQRSGFSINTLVMNNDGNFVHAYTNCGSGNCYPRIKEVSRDGIIIKDTIYTAVTDSFGLLTFDATNLYYNSTNDEYTILANVEDTARFNAGYSDHGTILFLRIDNNFQIVDTIYFEDPMHDHSYIRANGCLSPQGTEIIMCQTNKQSGWEEDEEARMDFFEIDVNGSYQKVAEFQVGQHDIYSSSLTQTFDSAYVFNYIQSFWNASLDEWRYTNILTKLDTNFNQVWETPLFYKNYPTLARIGYPQRVIETNDSSYVAAEGSASSGNSIAGSVLTKFNSDGEQLWQRRINKTFPSIQDTSYSDVEIRDLIENNKGGFTLFGRHDNNPLITGVEKKIYGYIAETNCLGFMAPPEAHADYQIEDNFQVSFYNNSMQAGSYSWDFGDGTVVQTDEYSDTLSHTYQGFGEYTVTLIAFGCDGENDTLTFDILPALHADPSIVTDGQGFFTIFPNPIQSGSPLYVYLNELDPTSDKVELQFLDEQGRIAQEIQINATEGTYILSPNLAAGIYFVNLLQEETLIQSRKLMVH